jgi:hypothetical protein
MKAGTDRPRLHIAERHEEEEEEGNALFQKATARQRIRRMVRVMVAQSRYDKGFRKLAYGLRG